MFRLDGDEATAKLRRNGMLEVRDFAGRTQQDGVWMLLRTKHGLVSVFEGNADTSIRVVNRELRPPAGDIQYSEVLVRFGDGGHGPDSWTIPHYGDKWKDDTRRALGTLGVRAGA